MKKAYQKPAFYVENFALSQSIAEMCEGVDRDNMGTLGTPMSGDPRTCAWVSSPMAYFTETVQACTTKVKEDFKIGTECYNNPNGKHAIFATS